MSHIDKLLDAVETHEASRLRGREQAFDEVLALLEQMKSEPKDRDEAILGVALDAVRVAVERLRDAR